MKTIIKIWKGHGTKILGFLTIVVAGIPQIEDVVADDHKKWWAVANLVLGAMTVQRGMTNTKAIRAQNPPTGG